MHTHHDHDDHDHDDLGYGNDRAHFDARAADWDDEGKVTRSRVIAHQLRARVPVDATTSVFEYGAGTGLGTQLLAATGPIGPATLADPSAGMRRAMSDKVDRGDLPDTATILDLDLAVQATPDEVFDMVMTVMTLHHIPDVQRVVAGLADMTAPGGHVAVVDLVEDAEGSFHANLEDFHGHDGFTHDRIRDLLTGAGLEEVSVEDVHTITKEDRDYALLLALGRRGS